MVEIHHQALAHRMGKDLFMVNVSLKPERGRSRHAQSLRADASRIAAGLDLPHRQIGTTWIRCATAFFSHDHIGIDMDVDQHAGLMKIINDPAGRWFHADVFTSTRTLLEHIQWSDPPKSLAERLEDNRKLQQQIDRDRAVFGYRKIA